MLGRATEMSPLWLAALPGIVAVAIWAVVDLQRFVLFAVLGTMLIPAALANPGGTQVALADVLLVVALGAWLVSGSARAVAGPWLSANPLLAPTMLFVIVNAESLAWSIRPHDTVVFLIQIVEIVIVLPIVFASLPRSLEAIRHGLVVIMAITCVLAIVTVVQYLPYALAGDLRGRSLAFGLNKNTIGSFVAAGLVLAYALWLTEGRRHAKLALGLVIFVELAGLFSTVSRGSIIGALVALVAVSLLLGRRRVLTLALVASAATAFLVIFGLSSGVDLSVPGSKDSGVVRVYSFANAVEKIREKPLLGTGAGTYEDYIPEVPITLPDPNNIFLLTWAEIGVFGLLALIILLGRFFRVLVAARDLPDEAAVLATATGCVTLSLLVHFQVDVTWTRGTSSLAFAMMGLMLAARRLSMAHRAEAAPAVKRPLSVADARPSPELA